jgi:hypothetical protein
MSPAKLTADGGSDDGAYRFRLDDLSAVPLTGLQLCLRSVRHIAADIELELARRSQSPPFADDPDRLVSAAEAAPILSTTTAHVWAMMRSGALPCIRVGKKYTRTRLSAVHALRDGQPLPAPRLRTPRIGRRETA